MIEFRVFEHLNGSNTSFFDLNHISGGGAVAIQVYRVYMYSIGIGFIVYIIVRVRGPTPPWRSLFQGMQGGGPHSTLEVLVFKGCVGYPN